MPGKMDSFKALSAHDKRHAVVNWLLDHAMIIIILLLATNKTVSGKSYLYPLIPFNGAALKRLLVRCRMSNKNS